MPWRKNPGLAPLRVADLSDWRKEARFDRFVDAIGGKSRAVAARLFVVFGFLVRWAIVSVILVWFWVYRPHIWDVPLGKLTLSKLFEFASGLVAIAGVLYWAFKPGKKQYKAWAWLGLTVAAIALYYTYH